MKLTKEKKTKFLKSLIFYLTFNLLLTGCSKSIENKLIGVWQIDYVEFNDQNISTVPVDEKYTMKLVKENNKKQFSIDGVKGSWLLDDSLLLFENIPESKTYIDSMFVVNDINGNSTIVLQNGNQKIATIKDGLVIPTKVTYKMKVISVNLDQLILQIDGDLHTYNKVN
tara:strand:- start:787 stop:1293 length:507 start_codon:yes stop_codon:yes gene_type:complete